MFRSKCFSSDRERRDRDKERLTASQESAKQTQEGKTREELKRVDAAEGMARGWNGGTREKIPSFKGD